ncbi:MAG: homocysteine S-methyltransferase family protein [Flexilinea sp.]
MEKKDLPAELQKGKRFILDGALGTNMQARGLPAGILSEQWVLEKPEIVQGIHSDFVDAGSQIILTATFCANPIHLADTPLAGKAEEINYRAVEIVKNAIGNREVYIAGSLGPIGKLMDPYGPLTPEDFYTSFAEQSKYLSEAGADLLVLETQYSIEEAAQALQGIRSVSTLPVVVSFSYDRGTRTMMGAKANIVTETFTDLGVDIIGINCGKGLDENTECLKIIRDSTNLPIWFKPNAGKPEIGPDGKTCYRTTAEEISSRVPEWLDMGAQLLGCCCGSTAEHIKAITASIRE